MEYTHIPHGSYKGSATCARCPASISIIWTATNKATGEVETFGSDCHYQVTGVDTRTAERIRRREERAERKRHEMPPAELAMVEAAQAAAAEFGRIPKGLNEPTRFTLVCIRDWIADYTPGTIDFPTWLQRSFSNEHFDPEVERKLRGALADFGIDRVEGKRMVARFRGQCGTCGESIAKGDPIVYNGSAHCVEHAA